jgi:hypothetical protein
MRDADARSPNMDPCPVLGEQIAVTVVKDKDFNAAFHSTDVHQSVLFWVRLGKEYVILNPLTTVDVQYIQLYHL